MSFKIILLLTALSVAACAAYACADYSMLVNDKIHEDRKAHPVWR